MRKYLIVLYVLCLSWTAFGWGATGHRATGYVAEKYLSKKAKKELLRILGGQSVAMASNWMDEIRSDSTYNYTDTWHWVTLLDNQTYDQSEKNPKGDIIETLERLIAELKTKKLDPKREAEYVKIIIHLIGDIHQPLHVGLGNDAGGGDIKVSWFRADSNLHRVWDSDMINETHLSYTELAESLIPPAEPQIKAWQNSSVRDWAMESVGYRKQVYNYGNGKLGYKYQYDNFDIVRLRLLQGGVRIAAVLNAIYG